MTIVRMRRHIGGTRNGIEWPQPGGTVDVPEPEALDLIRAGHAEPMDGAPSVPESPPGGPATAHGRPEGKAPVADWRAYAEALGLDTTGSKKVLIARVDEHLAQLIEEGADDEATPAENGDETAGDEPDGAPTKNGDAATGEESGDDDPEHSAVVKPGRRR